MVTCTSISVAVCVSDPSAACVSGKMRRLCSRVLTCVRTAPCPWRERPRVLMAVVFPLAFLCATAPAQRYCRRTKRGGA
jgi:hypothetical protein